METITPDFISTAEQVAETTEDDDEGEELVTTAMEQLDLLSQEWATKVSTILFSVIINCFIDTVIIISRNMNA